jgi:hypothetical protein
VTSGDDVRAYAPSTHDEAHRLLEASLCDKKKVEDNRTKSPKTGGYASPRTGRCRSATTMEALRESDPELRYRTGALEVDRQFRKAVCSVKQDEDIRSRTSLRNESKTSRCRTSSISEEGMSPRYSSPRSSVMRTEQQAPFTSRPWGVVGSADAETDTSRGMQAASHC